MTREFTHLGAVLDQLAHQLSDLSRDLHQTRRGIEWLDPAQVEIGLTVANEIARVVYGPRLPLEVVRRKEGL